MHRLEHRVGRRAEDVHDVAVLGPTALVVVVGLGTVLLQDQVDVDVLVVGQQRRRLSDQVDAVTGGQ